MHHNFFAYGSLAFPEVLKKFRNRHHTMIDATLHDFKLMTIRRDIFPTIIPSEGDKVDGKIIFNVEDDFLEDLDDYEGDEYKRVKVKLETDNGEIDAHTYVNRDKDYSDLEDGWDKEQFRKFHLEDLLEEFIDEEIEDHKL